MANDVSIKFGVEGENNLKSALKALKDQSKALDAELNTLVEGLKTTTDREGDLAHASEILERKHAAQEQSIDRLNDKLDNEKVKLADVAAQLEDARAKGEGNETEVARLEDAYNRQTSQVARATTELEKEKQGLQKTEGQMKDLTEQTGRFADGTEEASDKASIFGDVLAAEVASEAIITAVKKLAEAIKDVATASAGAADEINTLSSITGMSTDTIQEFQYMADLVDVSFSTISGSMKKLTKNMSSAKSGTGDAADAFKQLGISVTEQNGELRNNEDVFYEVLDALGLIENQTEADAVAMAIFGKSAQDLNPLIDAGADKMKALAQEAHDVGYVMDEETLEANNALQDSLDRMSKRMEAVKNTIGTIFAPALEAIVSVLADVVGGISKFIQENEWLQPIIAGVTVALLALAAALGISALIQGVTKAMEALNLVLSLNPIMLVVIAIAGLVAAFIAAYNTSEEFRNKVDAAFAVVKTVIEEFVASVKEGFKKAKETVLGAVEKVKGAIDEIKQLPEKAKEWGQDLISNFVQGIKDKVKSVEDAVSNVAQTVRDFLGFSEPKKGALSNFHTFAPDMIGLFAKGMLGGIDTIANASGRVASAVQLDASSIQAIGGYGGASTGGHMTIEVPLYIDGRQFARAIYSDIQSESLRRGGTMGATL